MSIRNGDAAVHNLVAKRSGYATCIDCGAQFARKASAKRCKPCASVHMDRESNKRNKERAARRRARKAAT